MNKANIGGGAKIYPALPTWRLGAAAPCPPLPPPMNVSTSPSPTVPSSMYHELNSDLICRMVQNSYFTDQVDPLVVDLRQTTTCSNRNEDKISQNSNCRRRDRVPAARSSRITANIVFRLSVLQAYSEINFQQFFSTAHAGEEATGGVCDSFSTLLDAVYPSQ